MAPPGDPSPFAPPAGAKCPDRHDANRDPEAPPSPSTIEAASGPGDDDEFDLADGYDTGSTGSTSGTSSIYAHTYEQGRRYHHFKNSRYPIPDDDIEQNREDMKHAMMLELLDGELFYAPVGDHPQKILDIGTGTGIWAIDVGDRYPSASVRGIDLTPIQPLWVPPNVSFLVDDCEDDWLVHDVDLAHFRFMAIILKDVPKVLGHAYNALKPGGWIELQELDGMPLCDDATMPPSDPVKAMYEVAGAAFRKFGMDVRIPPRLEPLLRDAGFTRIQCVVRKVPIGPWAKNKTLRIVGYYQKRAVLELCGTFANRPFAAMGMSEAEGQIMLAQARRGLEDGSAHRYFNYYFWFAQKPGAAAETAATTT